MSTGAEGLIAKRDELLGYINDHYYLIIEISKWLSSPILETLTPQQVDEYQELIIFYMERIDDYIGQLVAVLSTLATLGYIDLYQEILDQIDDMLFALNKILGELPGNVDIEIDTPIIDTGGSYTQIQIDLNAEIAVALEADQGFWEDLMETVGDVITAPLDWLIELGEEFTMDAMGIMFSFLIDSVADRLSGFMDNAVGSPREEGI